MDSRALQNHPAPIYPVRMTWSGAAAEGMVVQGGFGVLDRQGGQQQRHLDGRGGQTLTVDIGSPARPHRRRGGHHHPREHHHRHQKYGHHRTTRGHASTARRAATPPPLRAPLRRPSQGPAIHGRVIRWVR